MKITVPLPRPRNPVIAAAKFRRAGSHRASERSKRQRGSRALQRELGEEKYLP